MLRYISLLICVVSTTASCPVSHTELWNCALQDKCINVYQLHAMSMKHKATFLLQRPFIMAVEGPKYKRLFQDCDTNHDNCIDLNDIATAGDHCQRSCIWRQTMKSILC